MPTLTFDSTDGLAKAEIWSPSWDTPGYKVILFNQRGKYAAERLFGSMPEAVEWARGWVK